MRQSSAHRQRRRPVVRLSAAAALLAGGGGVIALTAPGASAACSDIEVVSARGTFEPGTLGTIVGDPVFAALQKRLTGKNLTSHKVDYPADLSLGSSAQGNTDLVNHVKAQASSCPAQKFILVGYSQGANVVDNSIGISSAGSPVGGTITATLPDDVEPKVSAVLLFGNPIRSLGKSVTGTYADRTHDVCAQGDPVCESGGNDTLAHLSYRDDAEEAAAFAAGKV
ncbi:cutinase family protein [Streptomyces sp. BV286]|uniref:cutinase family protein n=1 Tax=unclassified Streptomyces TaxID=2593676 RepID=UPI001C2E5796|nr:cutinase family protein [Streptomyces sp. BV286]MBV1939068.1 cutinase family protein [Streptomyces sp. BV286]